MFFTIKTPKNVPLWFAKTFAIRRAIGRIGLYRSGVTEGKLNERFMIERGKSLKVVCKELLANGEVALLNERLVFKFGSAEDDKTALLITYGDGVLQGSRILQYALFR